VVLSAFVAGIAAAAAAAGPPPAQGSGWETIGQSEQGRPIRALRVGSPRARVKVLVVGVIHGNEQAGRAVVTRLRRTRPPRGTALWLVDTANPDGMAVGSRGNANGVDLNRNFPYRWQPQDGVYESGSGPASEAETQVMQRFIEREKPRVTLWYHQALHIVVKSTGDPVIERLYSARSRLPRRSLPRYHGTAVSWQNHSFPGDSAFVVELPGGPLPSAGVRRHANAVLAVARAIAPPREVSKPIPFGDERKADMAEYAERHYGIHDFRLRDPKVIVEHYTATSSFAPVSITSRATSATPS
jgi:protein MpaA